MFDSQGIIAVVSLWYFNLANIAHMHTSHLRSLGEDWLIAKEQLGWKRIMYASHLIANPRHAIRRTLLGGHLSLFFTAVLFYHFRSIGLDVAICRMRSKTGMASAGRAEGGSFEKSITPTGMAGEQVDLMSVEKSVAEIFPFRKLGERFMGLYTGRVTDWSDIPEFRNLSKL